MTVGQGEGIIDHLCLYVSVFANFPYPEKKQTFSSVQKK